MASRDSAQVEITPEVLLKAYACGIFPMAENADDPALYWIEPELRGVIPLETFHVPARLARTVRAEPFAVICNRDFDAVLDGCAAPGPGRTPGPRHRAKAAIGCGCSAADRASKTTERLCADVGVDVTNG